MNQSTITIDVALDENRIPQTIRWNATESSADQAKIAKAMMLAFWDGADKTALRVDLWTKDMMVDEMTDFFYQTLLTMADTFEKATGENLITEDLRDYCHHFAEKMEILPE